MSLGLATFMGTGSFNGLSFGSKAGDGSGILFDKVQGIHDKPQVKVGDIDKTYDHGMWAGDDFFTMRSITLDFRVVATSASQHLSLLNSMINAFNTSLTELPLYYMNSTRYSNVRVRKMSPALDIHWEQGMLTCVVSVQMDATDPRQYDANIVTITESTPSNAQGVTFPVTFPIVFTADPTGSFTVTNNGNLDTRPIITISGPISSPFIQNVTTGQYLWWPNLTLGASDYLTVDLARRGSWLNGTGPYTATPGYSQNYQLASGYSWWSFQPGTTTVIFRGNLFNQQGSLSMPFASAWA